VNQRGILFTLIALLFVLAILTLNSEIRSSTRDLEPQPELTRLRELGKVYRDIERSLVQLDLNGGRKKIVEQGLPFSYILINPHRIILSQELPLNQQVFSGYFDSVQGYRVFYLGLHDDLNRTEILIDMNAATDLNWGSILDSPSFLLEPVCARYQLSLAQSTVDGGGSQACSSMFDPNSIRRTDINILVKDPSADFNFLRCNGSSCPTDSFNPANPLPFFSVNFLVDSCQKCTLSQTLVSGHYATTADFNVFLTCSGPNCHSKGVTLAFGPRFRAWSDANRSVDMNIGLDFNRSIQSFRSMDFNFSVKATKYQILRTNRVLTLPN